MPGYKGHLFGGLVAFLVMVTFLVFKNVNPSAPLMFEWLLCTLAGSLFPDVDVKSKGQNYFYKLLLIILLILLVNGYIPLFILLAILAVTPMIVRHRGLFHKLWFIISFPLLIAVCLISFYPHYKMLIAYDIAFFILGAISHLYLDLGLKRLFQF